MEYVNRGLEYLDRSQRELELFIINRGKATQRRLYTCLIRRPLLFMICTLLLALPLLNGIMVLTLGGCYASTILNGGRIKYHCTTRAYKENISGKSYEQLLSYGPIDVVYTWVNGSDPIWLAKKKEYESREERLRSLRNSSISASLSLTNTTSTTTTIANTNTSTSSISLPTNISSHAHHRRLYSDPDMEGYYPDEYGLSDHQDYRQDRSNYPYRTQAPTMAPATREGTSEQTKPGINATGGSERGTARQVETGDDVLSENRYRDSNELRFSLRSLERFAPWVRHIYLVTDNQIPKWLDMENPHLTIVPHTSIFLNKSHLPVFSSPAIEAHLHRIPGLSKKFIYFNDDVFLGSDTLPEDFVLPSGVQKVYLSWEVPKCNEGCSDTWIGDGYCDKACNVSACNWDYPDCVNATTTGPALGTGTSYMGGPGAKAACSIGCPNSWIADKVCDVRCNNADCAWDAGDCGVGLLYERVPGASLSPVHINATDETGLFAPPLMTIPFGTPAVYINLTSAFDGAEFISASHNNDAVVQNAVLIKKHKVVVLMLYHSTQATSPHSGNVTIQVKSRRAGGGFSPANSLTAIFRIILEPNRLASLGLMKPVKGYASPCHGDSLDGQDLLFPRFAPEPVVDLTGEAADGAALILHKSRLNSRDPSKLMARLTNLEGNKTLLLEPWEGPLCQILAERGADRIWHVVPPPRCAQVLAGLNHTVVVPLGEFRSAMKGWRHGRLEITAQGEKGSLVCTNFLIQWGNKTLDPPITPIAPADANTTTIDIPTNATELARRYRRLLLEGVTQSLPEPQWIDIRLSDGLEDAIVEPLVSENAQHGGGLRRRRLREDDSISSFARARDGGPSTNMSVDFPYDMMTETSLEEAWNRFQQHPGYLPPDLWWFRLLYTLVGPVDQDPSLGRGRRKLLDTFGESLIHVNRLYHQTFGREQRKVPAHMPHMIDKDIMAELQDKWKQEWEATSSHRFRSGEDMQYSFSYFYYMMNRLKIMPLDMDQLWKNVLDVDGNGQLDDNEMITLVALAYGRDPTYEYLMEIKECIVPTETETNTEVTNDGTVTSTTKKTPIVTLDRLKQCKKVMDDLHKNVRRRPTWSPGAVDEVSFEMIGDDIDKSRAQLNSIRSRRTKFICINDDMRNPAPDVQALLQHFYLSFFPLRSQFELPYHLENKYLYLDEYQAAKRKVMLAKSALIASIIVLLGLIVYDFMYGEEQPQPQRAPPPQAQEEKEEGKEGQEIKEEKDQEKDKDR